LHYSTTLASNGKEAIKMVTGKDFNIAFIDKMLFMSARALEGILAAKAKAEIQQLRGD